MRDTSVITAAVIEDERDIREGLREMIDGTRGHRCTGTFASVEDALETICSDPPDVVLLDIGLPGMSGIEGIPLFLERCPHTRVLVLTVYGDDDRIFAALCAGACGYLLKNTPSLRVMESLREAIDGGGPMSPEVARRVIQLFRDFRPSGSEKHRLTPHELRILRLLAEGHSCKSVANELHVSVNTIEFHLKQIYAKLHVHSKTEAVVKALRSGLVR